MDINAAGAFEQIKIKTRHAVAAGLDKLLRKNKRQNKLENNETKDLLENLAKARNEWWTASVNYEFAKEDELIDYYSYLIKASQIKYDYLLKKIKEKGTEIKLDEVYDLKFSKIDGVYNNLK